VFGSYPLLIEQNTEAQKKFIFILKIQTYPARADSAAEKQSEFRVFSATASYPQGKRIA
jgi:hypothetical protein